jgi:hypothetical protein
MIAFSGLDATITTVKRAIDRHNQRRNDPVEAIDEALLARLVDLAPRANASHCSATRGPMIDRLSILSLKVHHMGLAAARPDAATQDRALNPYLSRETIGRVAPSNGPNPAATADG